MDYIHYLLDLARAFNLFDRDGSGEISKEELTDVMNEIGIKLSQEELDDVMKLIDTSGWLLFAN